MVPDADLQMAVALKALREVVAPALDPANRVALEQLHLSIATLTMVRAGLPLQHQRARTELANANALAELIVDAGAHAPKALMKAKAALSDALLGPVELDAIRIELLEQIDASVAGAAGSSSENAVAKAVVKGSKTQFDLARAWCKGAGFEVNPDEVAPLEGLLKT